MHYLFDTRQAYTGLDPFLIFSKNLVHGPDMAPEPYLLEGVRHIMTTFTQNTLLYLAFPNNHHAL